MLKGRNMKSLMLISLMQVFIPVREHSQQTEFIDTHSLYAFYNKYRFPLKFRVNKLVLKCPAKQHTVKRKHKIPAL